MQLLSDLKMTEKATDNQSSVRDRPDWDHLPEAAQRALLEAEERRRRGQLNKAAEGGPESGGPSGKEPTRYGDWEKAGRAIDFS